MSPPFSSQTDAHLLLSGRHIDQLLRNLDDSATLLKNVLKSSTRLPQEHTAAAMICSSRVRALCQCSVTSVLWVTIAVQVLMHLLVQKSRSNDLDKVRNSFVCFDEDYNWWKFDFTIGLTSHLDPLIFYYLYW